MRMQWIVLSIQLLLVSPVAQSFQWEALPETAPTPADNPTTPEKVELGRMLYMDPRFSSTGTVSCNSCHNVMLGGEDNRAVSMGVHGQTGGRSAPTVWNAAFSSSQFWDGRAASLEDQATGPVTNPIEMGMGELQQAMNRVRNITGYRPFFEKAFPGENAMTVENAAKAVAAYERTLITPGSAYDRYVLGDKKALSEQQVRGMETFAKIGCASCHSGPAFSGPPGKSGSGLFMRFPSFRENDYIEKYDLLADEGRYAVTNDPVDRHVWKVPTLRNIALTAPYFHNGAVPTLNEAVRLMAKVQLNRDLPDNDTADIVAFLMSLSGPFPQQPMPQLPPTPGRTVVQ